MAFGTDIHMEKADAGSIRGEQKSIAVGCWFTSKGDTSLQLLKYQDEEGQNPHGPQHPGPLQGGKTLQWHSHTGICL